MKFFLFWLLVGVFVALIASSPLAQNLLLLGVGQAPQGAGSPSNLLLETGGTDCLLLETGGTDCLLLEN